MTQVFIEWCHTLLARRPLGPVVRVQYIYIFRVFVVTIQLEQVNDGPCTTYLGSIGSGNYVKMVHNGIEYGDMQLIAEVG